MFKCGWRTKDFYSLGLLISQSTFVLFIFHLSSVSLLELLPRKSETLWGPHVPAALPNLEGRERGERENFKLFHFKCNLCIICHIKNGTKSFKPSANAVMKLMRHTFYISSLAASGAQLGGWSLSRSLLLHFACEWLSCPVTSLLFITRSIGSSRLLLLQATTPSSPTTDY